MSACFGCNGRGRDRDGLLCGCPAGGALIAPAATTPGGRGFSERDIAIADHIEEHGERPEWARARRRR